MKPNLKPGRLGALTRRVVRAAYSVVERLVPRDRTACFISYPDVEDNALAVFEAALRLGHDPRAMIWLVSDVQRAHDRLDACSGNEGATQCRIVRKNSLIGLWCFLRAGRVYFTHGHYWFVGPSSSGDKLINLWHGMPLKSIGLLDGKSIASLQGCDRTIASSAFFQPLMAAAFNLPNTAVAVTGLPRCDRLLAPTSAAKAFRAVTAGPVAKLVFWLPTYTIAHTGEPRNDSTMTGEEVACRFIADMRELAAVARERECAIILKLHPADFLNSRDLPAVDGVTVLHTGSPWLRQLSLYEMLSVADGLITDLSSVCFDFMATRKPILVNRAAEMQYTRDLLFDPAELFGAVYATYDWRDANPFFDALQTGELMGGSAATKFCAFSDNGSSARVLEFAPLPPARECASASRASRRQTPGELLHAGGGRYERTVAPAVQRTLEER